ncbi:DsbC family protein [Hydromonas duriensis]|uniref:Thiol:disulfide interchange protein n=1 Tax=Hydromonas duriensis TaxID=1527608 RepID=A0A4R6Y229_9BURK|nr:DsbC family protein [Hydromonas duriensis]TDR30286.1 thiol:disulfide interchange protein DsbC [Hydromonas duriensis]
MKLNIKKGAALVMTVGFMLCGTARAQAEQWTAVDTVTANLQKRYPATPFKDIKNTPIAGVYQVTMGKNVGYVDESGRYFMFGHLFDMQSQTDLTAVPKDEANKLNFKDLPLEQAIKIKKGNGKQVFAVFSDPECPYCKQLENTLTRMDNYTQYVFLYPLDSLHPKAKGLAKQIWCAKQPAQAWQDLMLDGIAPTNTGDCAHPIDKNVELGGKLGASGTPTLIRADGTVSAGAMPRAELEQWLKGQAK